LVWPVLVSLFCSLFAAGFVGSRSPMSVEPPSSVTPIEYLSDEQPLTNETEATSTDGGLSTMRNPAAVYCTELGHQFVRQSNEAGEEETFCQFADGTSCPLWDFYRGTCGKDFNACAQRGLGTRTASDGADPVSSEYAECVDDQGQVVDTAASLIQLYDKVGVPLEGQEETTSDEIAGDSITVSDVPAADATPLPSSFDWRNNGGDWLSPVKDQGICGSCWAFAAVGASEAALNLAANNPALDLNLSEQYLISGCSSAGTCAGGLAANALAYIRDSGIPDESCFPYTDGSVSGCTTTSSGACDAICTYRTGGACSDHQCSERCSNWSSRLKKVSTVYDLGEYPSRSTIKSALLNYGPLAVRMYPYGTWSNGVLSCSDNSTMGHAVVLVGYNDAGSYWIIRNSWGTGYEDGGYFKVAYGTCAVERFPDAVVATSATVPTNVAASDGAFADHIRVTWNAVSGATSYKVLYTYDPAATPAELASVTTTQYDDYTATSDATVYYAVQACNDTACGEASALDGGYRLLAEDSYEADNDQAHATALVADTSQVHSIVPLADVDWYRFTLNGTSGVTIETSGFGNDDTKMALYDSALNLIASDDDGGERYFSRLNFPLDSSPLSAGTYYVTVSQYDSSRRIASYSILLTATAPPPSGVTASDGAATETISWNAVTGVDRYRVYSSKTADGPKSVVGETTSTSLFDGSATPLQTYYYWVRSHSSAGWGSFSVADTGRRGTITPIRVLGLPVMRQESSTGFAGGLNSSFDGSRSGWLTESGTWTVGANYFTGTGVSDSIASAAYYLPFTDLDYTVRLRRTGNSTGANRLFIRGQPKPFTERNSWQRAYLFQYTNDGACSVWVSEGSQTTALLPWQVCDSVATDGAWNTVRVVADGETLGFIINGTLVWVGSDATLTGGLVGFGYYAPAGSSGDLMEVDWATVNPADTEAADEIAAGGATPGGILKGGDVNSAPSIE